jgi:hypothetical protein
MSQVCVPGTQDHPKVSEKMFEYIIIVLWNIDFASLFGGRIQTKYFTKGATLSSRF